jgi:uncharacterized protein YecT (DUF1311 family)
MRRALALIAALLPAAAAADCGPEAATQADLNACLADAYAVADTELNALYDEIRARLPDDADTAALLTRAQRAWIAWRDAECDFAAAGVDGGSAYPMIRVQCMADLTAARSADFRRYLACAEGDLACPLPPR